MKSWTRTLNLDDAHTLLALVEPGMALSDWADACHANLPDLSAARRRELVRMLRDGFLTLDGDRIAPGLFLTTYQAAPATAQMDLMQIQWALSHGLSLVALDQLLAPALRASSTDRVDIPLSEVEELVAEALSTSSAESRRKTRTVLLGALEGMGVLETRGTGQHRTLAATHGHPHPLAYGYLIRRDLLSRGTDGMMRSEAVDGSLATRATLCTQAHAEACLASCVELGVLEQHGDEIRAV